MSKHSRRSRPASKQTGAKRLIDELSHLDLKDSDQPATDHDVISLLVSEALNGEDIARRHPAAYRRLLSDPGLRQAFLDALESVQAERDNRMEVLPGPARSGLKFLKSQLAGPDIQALDRENWRTTWQRTLNQLQAVFSPPKLVYRADPDMLEDAWFTVLRDEIEAGGVAYAVMLECTLVSGEEEALASYITVALTLGPGGPQQAAFPLRASLDWGEYQQSITIPQEGRARFPDIPLAAILDVETSRINRDLKLTLETAR